MARRLEQQVPNWYQPHWILSGLLVLEGKRLDGLREAAAALDLAGDSVQRGSIAAFQQMPLAQPAGNSLPGAGSAYPPLTRPDQKRRP